MNAFMMDKNGNNTGQEAPAPEEYGDEVMSAGWNPQLTQASQYPVAQLDRHVNVLTGLAGVDVDAFLQRMYECQR